MLVRSSKRTSPVPVRSNRDSQEPRGKGRCGRRVPACLPCTIQQRGSFRASKEETMTDLNAMAASVGALLKQRKESVAVSESSTAGLVSAALLAVPWGVGLLPGRRGSLHGRCSPRPAADSRGVDGGDKVEHRALRAVEGPYGPGEAGRRVGPGRDRGRWAHGQPIRGRRRPHVYSRDRACGAQHHPRDGRRRPGSPTCGSSPRPPSSFWRSASERLRKPLPPPLRRTA